MANAWLQLDGASARKPTGFSLEALEKSWGKKEQITGAGSSQVFTPFPAHPPPPHQFISSKALAF